MRTSSSGAIVYTALVLYGLYAAVFILRTSFVIGDERYFTLFDDAMVSMRYAKNLVDGHGLVWNPGGERVEGYTNPLWVLVMAVAHLLPLAPSKVSLAIQVLGAVLMMANLVVVGKLAGHLSGGSGFAVGSALLLTGTYLPLNNWALQGLEVGLLTLLVTGSAWLIVRSQAVGRFPTGAYLLLAVGILVRMDAAVLFLAASGFLICVDRANMQRHLLFGSGVFAVCLLGQTVWRWTYYGEMLPNTYYLKMTGYPAELRIGRGALVFLEFLLQKGVALTAAPICLALTRRRSIPGLLLVLILSQAGYSVYVGGDAWEWAGGSNRYLAVVMPLAFVLVASGLYQLRVAIETKWLPHPPGGKLLPHVPAAFTASVCACMLQFNAVAGLPSLLHWILLYPPLHVDDNRQMVQLAATVRRVTDEDASVAVVWAGALAYFMNRPAIDKLGKNDRVVARAPMRLPPADAGRLFALRFFYPGHLKYDFDHSVRGQRPDVIAQMWQDLDDDDRAFLESEYAPSTINGHTLYFRRNSPRVRWSAVEMISGQGQQTVS